MFSCPITKDMLVDDLVRLGIQKGDLLNVKLSMKSIGYVIGGPRTVLEALIEAVGIEGTIVTDAFIKSYPLPLSRENAIRISDKYTPSYAGSFANAMIHHPDACRSMHPIQRFVAVGAQSQELMYNHTSESPAYDVLRVMAESGYGRNLKVGSDEKVVGVGTTHVAITTLQLNQNRPKMGVNYYNYSNNKIQLFERNWPGGCEVGFRNFIPLYQKAGAILYEGKVGNADSKITDMEKTLKVEIDTLSKNNRYFFCNEQSCRQCRLSWEFSDGSIYSVKFHELKKQGVKKTIKQVARRIL